MDKESKIKLPTTGLIEQIQILKTEFPNMSEVEVKLQAVKIIIGNLFGKLKNTSK